jgi:predicted nicotinamide N-methyase
MAQDRFAFDFQLSPEESAEGHFPNSTPLNSGRRTIFPDASSLGAQRSGNGNFCFLEDVNGLLSRASVQEIEYDFAPCSGDGDEQQSHSLLRVRSSSCSELSIENLYPELESKQADIIPGKYEGGMKLWECSLDLCRYLWKAKDHLKVKYTLELGCGHGLPGCLVLRNSLKSQSIPDPIVVFADFNDFVLRNVTVANVVANTRGFSASIVANSIALGAGDWFAMSRCLSGNKHGISNLPENGRFDLLLAAETTYTPEAAEATAIMIANHLVPVEGIALVASKRYYFGCGGGTDSFRKAAEAQCIIINNKTYRLITTTEEEFDNGSGNIRELLKIVLLPESSKS